MLLVFAICSCVCLLVFCCRRLIFSYIGSVIYKMAQKSVESCAGKVLVESNSVQQFNNNNADSDEMRYPIARSSTGADFLIDVVRIGQGFNLKNSRFCSPSPLQDILPDNDLA